MAFEDAVAVDSIAEERAHVARHPCQCGGKWSWQQQALLFNPDKVPFDRITVQCEKCNRAEEFWFDVRAFFGKL